MNQLFKCRASKSGTLATNPKKKTEKLSQTTKTHVEIWLKEHIYGHKYTIKSKYLERGKNDEDKAIDKAIELLNLPFVTKNENKFQDDFFTGEPDLILDNEIIDIKCSWDCFTFPLFSTELPDKDYYYQVQVYMHLTGKKKARVVYVLLDTPATFASSKMEYGSVKGRYRIKEFVCEYDPDAIAMLKGRVEDCREYVEHIII